MKPDEEESPVELTEFVVSTTGSQKFVFNPLKRRSTSTVFEDNKLLVAPDTPFLIYPENNLSLLPDETTSPGESPSMSGVPPRTKSRPPALQSSLSPRKITRGDYEPVDRSVKLSRHLSTITASHPLDDYQITPNTNGSSSSSSSPTGRRNSLSFFWSYASYGEPTSPASTPSTPSAFPVTPTQNQGYWKKAAPARTAVSTEFWMPDNKVKKCYECGAPFTVFKRRHHCRICGQIFCYKCSDHFIGGDYFGVEGKIRVCTYCFKNTKTPRFEETRPRSGSNPTRTLAASIYEFSDVEEEDERTWSKQREISMSPSFDSFSRFAVEGSGANNNGNDSEVEDSDQEDDDSAGHRRDDIVRVESVGELTLDASSISSEGSTFDIHRHAIESAANSHLRNLIHQMVNDYELHVEWEEVIWKLVLKAVLRINIPKYGKMDPRYYIKVKKIPGNSITESEYVEGVVFKKNVAHRKMKTRIDNPRILLLACALEYERV